MFQTTNQICMIINCQGPMTIHQRLWGFQPPFSSPQPWVPGSWREYAFPQCETPGFHRKAAWQPRSHPPKKKRGVKPVTPKMRWCKTQNASFCGSTTILRNLDPGWSLEDVPFMSIDHLHDGKHDPYPIWPRLCAIFPIRHIWDRHSAWWRHAVLINSRELDAVLNEMIEISSHI